MSNIVQTNPRLPNDSDILLLKTRLYELWREISTKHNSGYFWETAGTAAPTTGTWSQGDKCQNTAPVEAGGVGNKYVVIGWICTASGAPGTWLQMRTLTGN